MAAAQDRLLGKANALGNGGAKDKAAPKAGANDDSKKSEANAKAKAAPKAGAKKDDSKKNEKAAPMKSAPKTGKAESKPAPMKAGKKETKAAPMKAAPKTEAKATPMKAAKGTNANDKAAKAKAKPKKQPKTESVQGDDEDIIPSTPAPAGDPKKKSLKARLQEWREKGVSKVSTTEGIQGEDSIPEDEEDKRDRAKARKFEKEKSTLDGALVEWFEQANRENKTKFINSLYTKDEQGTMFAIYICIH